MINHAFYYADYVKNNEHATQRHISGSRQVPKPVLLVTWKGMIIKMEFVFWKEIYFNTPLREKLSIATYVLIENILICAKGIY